MKKLLIVVVASVLVVPGGVFAQIVTVPSDDRPQTPQRSFSTDLSPLRDRVKQEAIRLANSPSSGSVAQGAPPQRSWAGRHPVLLGTLIGLGTGLAVNYPTCRKSSDYTCTQLGLVLGGIGAGVGAGVGGVVAIALR